MELGTVGLGKMGMNLTLNLLENGHDVTVYDRDEDKIAEAAKKSAAAPAYTLEELVESLTKERIVWVMVPAGRPVEQVIESLSSLLESDDIIIDGGNSHYKKTLQRKQMLAEKGINLVDAGTSGGVSGARHGACMMIGAENSVFAELEPVFADVTVEDGYIHTGKTGSGHFVKMVHNGIEYGILQAIGEGFEVLEKSDFDLDHGDIARVWNNGSVIESWLMKLTRRVFAERKSLDDIEPVIGSSGEGKWTVEEAIDMKVPTPVLAESLFSRYRSQQEESYGAKLIAALRNQFGGHEVEEK